MSQLKRLILIDGHALAYRAHFALFTKGFSTKDGQPTGAIYGFTKMLIDCIGAWRPDCLAVAFDRAAPTFRHEAYDAYKAHRAPMPDDLQSQMEPIREVVRAFEIPIFELDGYEADDVIGTISRQAFEQGLEVLILTGDRDAFQLVKEHVKVVMPSAGVSDLAVFGPDEVLQKMGVSPDQIPDLKGLMGDKSDNIPGVPGIGEKGAVKLLSEYGTVKNVYDQLDGIKGKLGERLREGAELARLSVELATIDQHVPLTVDWRACELNRPDEPSVRAVLTRFEFNSILRQLPRVLGLFKGDAPEQMGLFAANDGVEAGDPPPDSPARPLAINPVVVDDQATLDQLGQALADADCFSFDCETDGLQSTRCNLVGLAIATGGPTVETCQTFYIPVGHLSGVQLPWEASLAVLQGPFADPGKTRLAHNAKFDLNVLSRHELNRVGVTFDTMLADYLVHSGRSHGLKSLAKELLGYEMTSIDHLIGKGAKAITMARVPIGQAAPYAAADVAVTVELWHHLKPQLDAQNQTRLFLELETPLIPVLMDMEQHGVKLDVDCLNQLSVQMGDRLQELETRIHELAETPFNIASTRQLGQVLFEKLGLPVLKRNKSGPSTDAEVLEELAPQHAIVALILEYRQLGKLKSTYVDALPALVDPVTQRVHTSYQQTVAATGRLSSTDPNLQNIPIRTDLGREIRKAFVPSVPGRVILSADYSQIELRILAHFTEDPSFVAAFLADEDIHAVTASEIFGVPLDAVTTEMRRRAKTTNFGVIYGQTDFGLAKKLMISRADARQFITTFNARYPGIQAYMHESIVKARQKGYAETLLGRRRPLPEVKSPNRQLRELGERMAINTPIQGSSADIIKVAMIRLEAQLKDLPCQLLLQVHDELVFEVATEAVEEVSRRVRNVMAHAYPLRVPLKVDIHTGATWMDAK